MQGRMRTAAATAGVALAAALALAPAAAFAQGATMPGGSLATTDTTGPDAPLTLGTGAEAQFGGGTGTGSGSSFIDETQPLADTGGGDVAIGLGTLLIAAGGGLRVYTSRRKR